MFEEPHAILGGEDDVVNQCDVISILMHCVSILNVSSECKIIAHLRPRIGKIPSEFLHRVFVGRGKMFC